MLSALNRLVGASAIALAVGALPGRLSAQVTVTPDGAEPGPVVASTAGNLATFRLAGRGAARLECWGTKGITCRVDEAIDLAGPTDVNVRFDAPAEAGAGHVFLRATQYVPAGCDPASDRCDRHVDIASRVYVISSGPESRPDSN